MEMFKKIDLFIIITVDLVGVLITRVKKTSQERKNGCRKQLFVNNLPAINKTYLYIFMMFS